MLCFFVLSSRCTGVRKRMFSAICSVPKGCFYIVFVSLRKGQRGPTIQSTRFWRHTGVCVRYEDFWRCGASCSRLTDADRATLVQWVADSGCREQGSSSQEHCAARPEDICVLTSPADLLVNTSGAPLEIPTVSLVQNLPQIKFCWSEHLRRPVCTRYLHRSLLPLQTWLRSCEQGWGIHTWLPETSEGTVQGNLGWFRG